ncbi:MAG: DUF1467 family protein [Rhodospirillaceae bacterium]
MSLAAALAIYLVIWWLTLFLVLPFGIMRVEPGDLLPGEDPGAPAKPRMLKKLLITTGVSLVFFAIFYVVYDAGWISFRE